MCPDPTQGISLVAVGAALLSAFGVFGASWQDAELATRGYLGEGPAQASLGRFNNMRPVLVPARMHACRCPV